MGKTVSVNLVANIGQYVGGMNKAAAATARLGDSATTSSKKAQSGFDLAGKGAMLMGAAVVGGMAMAVSKSMEFEKAMSAAAAATTATGSALGDLRDAAMKAGADTQYSATEAAQAITEMGKAGVSTADILDGGLNGALALAAAGQLDVAEAAEIASVAMTQFKLSGDQLPHVADLLAAGAGKAMGSVEDLGMALNQAGLVASAAGIGIEETTGTLAAFASAGLIGSDAGTSFRSMLQHLQNASGPAQEKMDELGISMYDAQGNFVGMEDLAGQLQTKMQDLTPAVRDAAMAQIFGSDAVRAANVLYSEGAEGIADWTSKVNDQGYAAEQAAKLNDNLAGDLERLGGSFDTLLISIGSGAQGPLRDLVQGLTTLIDAVGGNEEAFASLPGPVQLVLSTFGGLADLIGGLVGIFADLPGPVQAAVGAFGAWAVAGGSIQGTFSKIMEKLTPLKEGLASGWEAGTTALTTARAEGDGFGDTIGGIASAAAGAASGGLKSLASAVGPELGMAAAAMMVTYLIDGFQALTSASDSAKAAAEGLAESLTLTNDALDRESVRGAIEDVEGLTEILSKAGVSSKEAIDGLLGNAGAQDRVTEALLRYRGTEDKFGDINVETVRQAQMSYEELATGYDGAAGSARYFADESAGAAAGTRESGDAAAAAAPQVDWFTAATEAARTQVDEAKAAVDDFKLSLDILTGAHVSMIQVESAFYASLESARTALEGTTGAVLDQTGGLNEQTSAGRAAGAALIELSDDANLWISTMRQQGATTEEQIAKDQELRQNFYNTALQMTGSADAAQQLTDEIYGIPSERETKITADTGQATNAVNNLQTLINNLKGRVVNITARAIMPDLAGTSQRMGTYATGGYTGPGGKYTPAGLVHANEYVEPSESVDYYGTGIFEALHKRRIPREVLAQLPGYASGGRVAPASIVAELNAPSYDTQMNAFAGQVLKKYEPVQGMIGALQWAKSQVGKPYIWGGVGPAGYDCSGFMSAITNVIRGKSPYSRVGSTASFPWGGFSGGYGPFTIGSTSNAGGGIGHMAGTLLGVNVESRGGQGVVVGGSARGASNGLFSTRARLATFDSGGPLYPGYTLAYNGTGKTEWVSKEFSGGGARGGGGSVNVPAPIVKVYLDGQEWRGMARVEAEGVVVDAFSGATDRGRYNS